MPDALARRLWEAIERHGGLITLDEVTYLDIAEGAKHGWLTFDENDNCRPTEALRRQVGALAEPTGG